MDRDKDDEIEDFDVMINVDEEDVLRRRRWWTWKLFLRRVCD